VNTRTLVRQCGVALVCAFASALTMVSFVAAFEIEQPHHKVVVKFGDLNPERPDGIAVLYQRLHTAATRVCEPASPRDLGPMTSSDGCVAAATARAIASINIPALTSYYKSRNPHEST
jgi:UrcA family protein